MTMRITIEQYEQGLLFKNGRFVEVLDPGRYWKPFGGHRAVKVDLRNRMLTIQGQEMMTADKVTLRMNALVKFRVANPASAVLRVEEYVSQLYADAQLALRAEVASQTLDDLLASKAAMGPRVLRVLAPTAREYGIEILDLGLKDLILPGDIKEILNQVIAARKRAEAAVIERREEIAAVRSQANTAELYEKNPVLLRLKELEALEKALSKTVLVGPPLDLLRK
jgi:regulator of protease activity HflC (stomatin/prohibitin superfamily)